MPSVDGACLCGAVSYSINGALRPVVACHCSQCRKTSGHFVAATEVGDETLEIRDPEGALRWYRSSPSARRGFCSGCGSSLFWKRDDKDRTSIMAGTLTGDTGLTVEAHIYTADKGDYYTLDTDIPHFAADR